MLGEYARRMGAGARGIPLAVGEVFKLVYVAEFVKILVQSLEVLQWVVSK